MESCRLTLRGEDAHRFADEFVESKADRARRSLNKRGVRNIHRYSGDGVTHVAYERAAAHDPSWVMVSLLVERVDDRTVTVVVLVGGGGEGPFKLERVSVRRLRRGEDATGQAGRFVTVLEDVRRVCDRLGLDVDVSFRSDAPSSLSETIERKIFDS